MKVNLFMFGDDLAFLFNKEDLKNGEDRKVICKLIDHLYHTKCVMTSTDDEDLDEMLSLSPEDEVALTVLVHDGSPCLVRIKNITSVA